MGIIALKHDRIRHGQLCSFFDMYGKWPIMWEFSTSALHILRCWWLLTYECRFWTLEQKSEFWTTARIPVGIETLFPDQEQYELKKRNADVKQKKKICLYPWSYILSSFALPRHAPPLSCLIVPTEGPLRSFKVNSGWQTVLSGQQLSKTYRRPCTLVERHIRLT